VIHAVGTNDIFAMGGLGRAMPQTFIVFLIGTLSLAGIPFFGGFFSKEEIFAGVWVGGLSVPFAMLAIAAFLTAFYMFRVVFIVFCGTPHGHGSGGHAHDGPLTMSLPLWILAALSMAVGIGFAVKHPEAEFVAPGWITPLAVALALGGITLAWLTYQRRVIDADRLSGAFALVRDAAANRFYLDDAFLSIYRWAFLGLSRIIGWVDRYVVDGVLNVLSAWTLDAGDRLRRIQSGQPQDYVYGVALGVLLLLVWFHWLG
jgi:NADH-quinone oxidoreductase subunit L